MATDRSTSTAGWRQVLVGLIGGVLILGVGGVLIVVLFRALLALDPAITGAMITGIAAVSALLVGRYYERRQALEAQVRERKVPLYEGFIKFFFRIIYADKLGEQAPAPTEVIGWMVDTTRTLMMWGSDDVVVKWQQMRLQLVKMGASGTATQQTAAQPSDGEHMDAMFAMEELILAMRRDAGYPRTKLKRGDVLGLFIDDIERYR